MHYINAFIVGGIICTFGQLLISKTKLTSARILVLFVCVGALLTGLGIYEPIVQFGGAGATVPILGFGYNMVKGVMKEIDNAGFIGIFTGGIKSTAAGISAAVIFGFLASLIFNPKERG